MHIGSGKGVFQFFLSVPIRHRGQGEMQDFLYFLFTQALSFLLRASYS